MMKWLSKYRCIAFLFILVNVQAAAQQFSNASGLFGMELFHTNREYGNGVSFYDVNNDGLDDITIPGFNDSLKCFISNGNSFDLVNLVYCEGESKMALWGDYDNDGDPDLFLCFYESPVHLYRNDGDFVFVDVTEEAGLNKPAQQTYGASWGDLNNDGWLDLLVANYNVGPVGSWLFRSNGDGTFEDVSTVYGVNIGSDFSFQGTFLDINDDGWQDIHIANDRTPDDAILINNQDYYVNMASYAGLIEYCDAMTSTIGDYNHDGKFDIYVTNSDFGNFLWRNNGDVQFTNLAADVGVALYRSSWGANWMDWDNDTWEDLYINFFPSAQDGMGFFTNQEGMFEQGNIAEYTANNWYSFSSAKGDFNGDGYYDLTITTDNLKPYILFENNAGENNWLKIKLEGRVSNRDGLGSKIRYKVNGVDCFKYTVSGTNYISQDSQWIILGLGSAQEVEELQIDWLSGHSDIFYNVQVNQSMEILEGWQDVTLFYDSAELNTDTIQACAYEAIQLFAQVQGNIQWNDGTEGDSIQPSVSGWYYAFVENDFGIVNQSDSVYVSIETIDNIPINITHESCADFNDGAVSFDLEENYSIAFLNEIDEEVETINLSPGPYSMRAENSIGCVNVQTLEIVPAAPFQLDYTISNPSCFGLSDGSIFINALSGGTGEIEVSLWMDSQENNELELNQLPAGLFHLMIEDENGCVLTEPLELLAPDPLAITEVWNENLNTLDIDISGGTPPYQVTFNSDELVVWTNITPQEGLNNIVVVDNNLCSTFSSFTSTEVLDITEGVIGQTVLRFNGHPVTFNISKITEIEVFSLDGKLIEKRNFINSNMIIDTAHSLVLIHCIGQNQSVWQKVFLNK